MAQQTYDATAIVLKKVKLGESDLIITFLAEDGTVFEGVAKGARKPTSSFASRLELYSHVDVLMVCGKSLDIVKEARLVEPFEVLRTDYDASCNAAVIAELLWRIVQHGQTNGLLFPMAQKAFTMLGDADPMHGALISAGFVMKCVSSLGYMPSFDTCVTCGNELDLDRLDANTRIGMSYSQGGVICEDCSQLARETVTDVGFVRWLRALLLGTFEELAAADIDAATLHAMIDFLQTWLAHHVDVRLKSASAWGLSAC